MKVSVRLSSVLRLRCPVCNRGRIFKGLFDTPQRCPQCGYFFMRESGYFLPHVPIGYLATVAIGLGSWPFLYYVVGLRSAPLTLGIMISLAVIFGIWFLRYAKMLWLAIDLTLHPPVDEDFRSRGRQA